MLSAPPSLDWMLARNSDREGSCYRDRLRVQDLEWSHHWLCPCTLRWVLVRDVRLDVPSPHHKRDTMQSVVGISFPLGLY
jgi:hypothetical protein